jgi:hypothetical protein
MIETSAITIVRLLRFSVPSSIGSPSASSRGWVCARLRARDEGAPTACWSAALASNIRIGASSGFGGGT